LTRIRVRRSAPAHGERPSFSDCERGVMLDLVFLAFGLAAIALFGGYAVLLRRL
jgi:hypothetical protein